MGVRDYTNSVEGYKKAKTRFRDNTRLPEANRKLCLQWLLIKEKELQDGLSAEQKKRDAHRRAKTMYKYVSMLANISYWFSDLKNIKLATLKKFKDDFYNDRIKSITGKTLKCKTDYINKIFKSDFFRWLGHKKLAEETFTNGVKADVKTVEFIVEGDLSKLINAAPYDYHRIALMVLYYTGVRVGTLLNLTKNDFEIKYNPKTKVSYYHVHVRRDYTKSKADRTIPLVDHKANQALTEYLSTLQDKEYLIPVGYGMINKLVKELAGQTKVRTQPSKSLPTVHTLRKSCAIYLLNKGYSTDQVKAWLGHKPSSDAIDAYVNYLGLEFEPQVMKVQTDELLRLENTLRDNSTAMAMIQQQNDSLRRDMVELTAYVKKLQAAIVIVSNKNDIQLD